MKKWKINKSNPEIAVRLKSSSDLSLFCAEVLTARGISSIDEASELLSCNMLSDPFLIRDMQLAVECINNAISEGKKICIYGDYDCDGVISTVILYSYLIELGADVTYYIPERDEGYGLNTEALDKLNNEGVELIITGDNGITALKESAYAAALGMKMVITDHHQPLDSLPQAEAIVDPHRTDCPSPFKKFCGAGVVLKLVAALSDGDLTFALEQFGDLAAIATVADIVSLSGENRFLVQIGLRLLANTERVGLLALMDICGVSDKVITSSTLAFALAPRINAAGRFGSPRLAVNLLLEEDPERAAELAYSLEMCNRQRKETENKILEEVQNQIIDAPSILKQRVIMIYGDNWSHGVIGIVASRLQERFGKPVIIMTIEDDIVRGSARAFGEFSIFECLDYCRDCFLKYGGHPGAGGFSLKKENLQKFIECVKRYSLEKFPEMPVMTFTADKLLLPQDITIQNISSLEMLAPYGEGNPSPVFAICHAVVEDIVPISKGLHTKLKIKYGNLQLEVLIFRITTNQIGLEKHDLCDLLVTAEINTYNGHKQLSLICKDYRKSGIRQASYFSALASYEKFCRDEELPKSYYKALTPNRQELTIIYKKILLSGTDVDTLFMQLQGYSINYGKLLIALDIFKSLGLVRIDSYQNIVYLNEVHEKTDLEKSPVLQKLQKQCEEGSM
ncbi:MAG: single-stranded-DNA-specific exonuclease RecJ [Ruminococcus sp.]|nr:single-stranded-DNA-specific exonuclease RecJ [Ruminococcus sp.]